MPLTDPNLDGSSVPSPDLHRPHTETDPEVAAAIDTELHLKHTALEMIARANFASVAVRGAQASVFTNKAGAQPQRRHAALIPSVDAVPTIRGRHGRPRLNIETEGR